MQRRKRSEVEQHNCNETDCHLPERKFFTSRIEVLDEDAIHKHTEAHEPIRPNNYIWAKVIF